MKKIDLGSRGEVVAQLVQREREGLVKKCAHLRLDRSSYNFLPVCEEKWASEELDPQIRATIIGEWSEGQQAKWPRCPEQCPRFLQSADLAKTAGRDQYESRQKQKAGSPTPSAAVAKPIVLSEPEKITMAQLWQQVPVKMWAILGGILATCVIAAFSAGFFIGRNPLVRQFLDATDAAKQAQPIKAASPSGVTK